MNITLYELWKIGLIGKVLQTKGGLLWLWFVGLALAGIIAYLLGSLNFGIIISKLAYRDDIRKHGSGNAGMTNMLRTYGKGAAVCTLLGDALKAAFSILVVGHVICGEWGAYIAGLACIIGHVYPIYYGFKGGKGVITTAVMVLCLNPVVFLILITIFICIVATTKYISLGSCICALIYPLVLQRVAGNGIHVIIAAIVGLFIIYLHRSNIKRLRDGTENKISLKGKKKKSEDAEKSDNSDSDKIK